MEYVNRATRAEKAEKKFVAIEVDTQAVPKYNSASEVMEFAFNRRGACRLSRIMTPTDKVLPWK